MSLALRGNSLRSLKSGMPTELDFFGAALYRVFMRVRYIAHKKKEKKKEKREIDLVSNSDFSENTALKKKILKSNKQKYK